MLGTKCPSITSRWIQSAPAASTARTSSPSFEKSEARIDGAIMRGRGTKEADICAVFRKLFRMRQSALFPPNMRTTFRAMQRSSKWKNLPQAAPIADRRSDVPKSRKPSLHWSFRRGTALADQYRRSHSKRAAIRSSAMLPAIGAASAALDAIQSLTSPQPGSSSQSTGGFGSALSDAEDSSAASSAQSTVSGFSSALISSDNLNALIDAQSLSSGDAAGALDSSSSTSIHRARIRRQLRIRHGLIGL